MIVHIKYLRVFLWSRRLYIGKLPRDFRNGFMTHIYVMREFKKHFHDVDMRHKGLKGLKISQRSQENTCVGVLCWPEVCNFIESKTTTQMFACAFCEFSTTIFYRAPPFFWFLFSYVQNKKKTLH